MTHEEDGTLIALCDIVDLFNTLFLECRISHCKHLINEQDIWFHVSRNGERESDVHTRRVAFNRSIEKISNLGKLHNGIKLLNNLFPLHTENCPAEKNIFPPRKLGMKTGTHLKERCDLPVNNDLARCGFSNAIEDLEESRLSRTIGTDDANDFSFAHRKTDIFQR